MYFESYYQELSPYPAGHKTPMKAGGTDFSYSMSQMVNVGWLVRNYLFATGAPLPGFVDCLLIATDRDRVNICRCLHGCPLCSKRLYPLYVPCPNEHGVTSLGTGEIHVQGTDGVVYAAPAMIYHYVTKHRYYPPKIFQELIIAKWAGQLPPKPWPTELPPELQEREKEELGGWVWG